MSLLDRWVNPSELVSDRYSMFNLSVPAPGMLTPGKWHQIRVEWDELSIFGKNQGRLYIDGSRQFRPVALNRPGENGISYVHCISTADRTDDRGFLVASVAGDGN